MENNIDKDIEKVKEFLNGKKMQYGEKGYKNNNNFITIENILSELKKKDIEIEVLKRQVNVDNIILEKQDKELQTYKKMVSKIKEKIREGMKNLYVDTCSKDEGKYEAYMSIDRILEQYEKNKNNY